MVDFGNRRVLLVENEVYAKEARRSLALVRPRVQVASVEVELELELQWCDIISKILPQCTM